MLPVRANTPNFFFSNPLKLKTFSPTPLTPLPLYSNKIVIPDNNTASGGQQNRGPCRDQGDFVVLYDEAAEQQKLAAEEAKKQKQSRSGNHSRQQHRSWK